jgi:hypothetical protein
MNPDPDRSRRASAGPDPWPDEPTPIDPHPLVRPERLDAARLEVEATTAIPVTLDRHTNGRWTLSMDVAVDVELPDGRRIEFRRRVNLTGKQIGRKPRRAETRPRKRRA